MNMMSNEKIKKIAFHYGFEAQSRQIVEEMAELIKRNTRRYAKRQLTWFLRSEGINQVCLDGKTSDEAARECIDIING
jgi:tRNA A37 N6-isopentenylltransferase MiaA